MKKFKNILKALFVILYFLIALSTIPLIIYIVLHFISKYW
jgi:hypothetical protein